MDAAGTMPTGDAFACRKAPDEWCGRRQSLTRVEPALRYRQARRGLAPPRDALTGLLLFCPGSGLTR
jgi:hypothetical protein